MLGNIASAEAPLIESRLENLCRTQPVTWWQQVLKDLNIGVQPLNSLSTSREESLAEPIIERTVSFIRESSHPLGRPVEHINPTAVRAAHAPVVALSPAPKYGSSTCAVMRELSSSEEEIAAMAAEHVIADSWSDDYLPD